MTLSDDDIIYVWEFVNPDSTQPCLKNVGRLSGVLDALKQKHLDADLINDVTCHITALIVGSSTSSILVGTDQGSVASIRRNLNVKQGVAQDENTMWILPSQDEVITPHRVFQRFVFCTQIVYCCNRFEQS